MAVQARFCGSCGTPLAPGATFCGRCGAPVAATPIPVYQGYTYPQARPRAGRIGGDRTTQIAVAIGLLSVLVVVTVAVSALAIRSAEGSHHNCTSNCNPKIVTPLPASATYTSSEFKYSVDYSQSWKVDSQDSAGIVLATRLGSVSVVGSKGSHPLDQVILGVVGALPSATWQSVTRVSDLKGAHLAEKNGLGAVYSANLVGSNSTATKVRFAVIAASKNGVTVVMFAVDPADPQHFANGMPEGQLFDYMCTVFRWGG
jgi:zinc ribbon protein